MKKLMIAAAIAVFASSAAFAANPACEAQANEKKLSGAARTSFIKKCEKDASDAAKKTCEVQAAEQKLSGAAKNSFVTKCVKDAAAAAAAHK
jgi:opacity protein-like surface antigen